MQQCLYVQHGRPLNALCSEGSWIGCSKSSCKKTVSYIYLYFIYLLICLDITLEDCITPIITSKICFSLSVLPAWKSSNGSCHIVASSSCLRQLPYLAPQISAQNERDVCVCAVRIFWNTQFGREIQEFSFIFSFSSIFIISCLLLIEENGKISKLTKILLTIFHFSWMIMRGWFKIKIPRRGRLMGKVMNKKVMTLEIYQ